MFVPLGTEELEGRQPFPGVTVTIAILVSLLFLVEVWISASGGTAAVQRFISAVGLAPAPWQGGPDSLLPFYLTLFTSLFVHASLLHLGTNLVYLLSFGSVIEQRLGHLRFLILFFLSAVVASLVQIVVAPSLPYPIIGSSGAIAGLLGAYLLLFPFGLVRVYLIAGPLTRIGRAPALVFAAIWFLLQFFSGLGAFDVATAGSAGQAYWAHLGGFAAGLGLAWMFRKIARRQDRAPKR